MFGIVNEKLYFLRFISLSCLITMSSLFTKIINGEIPSYKIYEDEKVFAFLDIHPSTLGHTLLVPKVEVDYFAQLPADYASALMAVAQKLAPILDQAMGTSRTQLLIAGWDVPHTHIHLIPSTSIADVRRAETLSLSDDEMRQIQAKIIALLD